MITRLRDIYAPTLHAKVEAPPTQVYREDPAGRD